MKSLSLLFACSLLIGLPAFAGGGESGVGNGGGIWTCREGGVQGRILWAELVDLSEARREFQLRVVRDNSLSFEARILEAEAKIRAENPAYFEAYRRHMAIVRAELRLIDESVLERISDSLYRSSPDPRTCSDGVVQYEQLANFTHQGHLIVDNRLWSDPALTEVDRAALYVHEAIYSLLRETEQVTNSVKAREIVGYLFSDTPSNRYRHLLSLSRPSSSEGPLPQLGIYHSAHNHWAPIEMSYYERSSGRLYLTERDREGIRHTNHHVFQCRPEASELVCRMLSSSNRHISDVGLHRVVFSDSTSFVWMKTLPENRVRATRYVRR